MNEVELGGGGGHKVYVKVMGNAEKLCLKISIGTNWGDLDKDGRKYQHGSYRSRM
jgi:hypothetical protein